MVAWRNKKVIFCAALFIFFILTPAFPVQTVKATTYYSAPNGDYQDIRVSGSLTVGAGLQAFVGTGNFHILNNSIDGWVQSSPGPSGGGLTVANNFNIQNSSNVSLFYVDNVNHRVGIGTTSPLATLDVRGEVNTMLMDGYSNLTDPLAGGIWQIYDLLFDNPLGSGDVRNGFAGVTAKPPAAPLLRFIYMYIDATPLVLQSFVKSGSFRGPVAMNLDPDNRNTGPPNLQNPDLLNTNLIVGGSNTPRTAYASGGWTIGSSREFKTDIKPLSLPEYRDSLEQLSKAAIYWYHFKNEEDSRNRHIGFIAEEAPVSISTEDKKAINIGDTIGLLMASAKSLKEEQDSLRERLEELKK